MNEFGPAKWPSTRCRGGRGHAAIVTPLSHIGTGRVPGRRMDWGRGHPNDGLPHRRALARSPLRAWSRSAGSCGAEPARTVRERRAPPCGQQRACGRRAGRGCPYPPGREGGGSTGQPLRVPLGLPAPAVKAKETGIVGIAF